MKKFFLAALFPVLIAAGNAGADEITGVNDDLVRYYTAELFQWNYSVFGGLVLTYQNSSVRTAFGLNSSMKKALLNYSDSASYYRSYRFKNTTAHVLAWGGLAALITGVYLPVYFPYYYEDDYNYGGSYYGGGMMNYTANRSPQQIADISSRLIIGGLFSEIASILLFNSAQESIFNAVNIHNRNRIGGYRK